MIIKALIEVDEGAVEAGYTPTEWFEQEMGWSQDSGITLLEYEEIDDNNAEDLRNDYDARNGRLNDD